MRYTDIVFDIDGTLMDSTGAIRSALQRLAAELLGRRLTDDELATCLGLPADEGLASVGLPSDDATVGRWLALMGECWEDVSIFPGVERCLDALADDGLALGLVSSETREEMRQGFAGFGLMGRFSCVVTADDTSLRKPSPDPLLEYLRMSGADARSTLYVGDSLADALCAEAAGVDFALACWRAEPLREPVRAKGYPLSPDQLLELVEREDGVGEREPWLSWARELQAIAQAGLHYTKDRFDAERFARVRELSLEAMGRLSDVPLERLPGLFANEDGYQTPKLDSRAVIFDEGGRICLVHESLGDAWSLPGGWVDQGQTVFSNVVKESREEAGLEVVPERLIALEEHNLHNTHPFAWGIVKSFVICRSLGGEFVANSETTERGFFPSDALPPLMSSKNTVRQIEMCFAAREAGAAWKVIVD